MVDLDIALRGYPILGAVRTRAAAEVLTREVKVSIRTINEEEGEYEFTAATEGLVDMGLDAPECLRMSGCEYDESLPLLNAHSRSSATDVLGRAVMRKEGRSLVARVRFSKATQAARDTAALVKDRTVDSCSIGYLIHEFRELHDGETDGEGEAMVKGPAYVATRWRVKELSIVPIGADPSARRRAFTPASKEKLMKLKPNPGETREQFLARAMADAAFAKEIPDEAKRRAEVEKIWASAKREDAEKKPDDKEGDDKREAGELLTCPECGHKGEAKDFGDERSEESQDEGKPPERTLEEELLAERARVDEVKKRELDAKTAELAARKAQILTRWPASLREFLDELLLKEPEITPKAAWDRGLEELRRRMPSGGTPEPRQPGSSPYKAKDGTEGAPPAPKPDDRNEIGELIRFVR